MSKIDKSTLLQFQGASSGTWHGGGDGTTIHHGDIHSRFAHIYIYKHNPINQLILNLNYI